MPSGQSLQRVAPSSTLDRLPLVMDLFRDTPRLTLTDISRQTRIRWLRRHYHWYELGEALAEFGTQAVYRKPFDLAVAPLLRELHRVTGCVVHLGALEGNDVRYLLKVGEPNSRTRVGELVPAPSSTLGKALLAATRRAPIALASDPHQTAEFELVFGNCVSGFGCIGVHLGFLGGIAVGLSISGPAHLVRSDQWHSPLIHMTASAIAQYLDFRS